MYSLPVISADTQVVFSMGDANALHLPPEALFRLSNLIPLNAPLALTNEEVACVSSFISVHDICVSRQKSSAKITCALL